MSSPAASASSHSLARPTLRPILSSFPTPPSHIPASPAVASTPGSASFFGGYTPSSGAGGNGFTQMQTQVQITSQGQTANISAGLQNIHSMAPAPSQRDYCPGPPPLGPLPPLPSNTSPISPEEQKEIAFLKIRESWHSRCSSESASVNGTSASNESVTSEEGEGVERSSTGPSIENPDSSLHQHGHQSHQRQTGNEAEVRAASALYATDENDIESAVNLTVVNPEFDTPPPHSHTPVTREISTSVATTMTIETGIISSSVQDGNNSFSLSPPSPTPSTRTSSPDIQMLMRARSFYRLQNRNRNRNRRRNSINTPDFASALDRARLCRARSTPSLNMSAERRCSGNNFDATFGGYECRGFDDSLDSDLGFQDNLDLLEEDIESEEDIIDLKTPLPHLMLRLGLLSPHSKLLPRMTPSPEPHDPGREPSTSFGRNGGGANRRASPVGSMFSISSKHPRDARDTEKRRQRHKDGKLLRGGIGLTTGLGWSDSEDEDAPSALTDGLSRLASSLSRKGSTATSVSGYSYTATSMNTLSRKDNPGVGARIRQTPSSSSISNSHPHIYHHSPRKSYSRGRAYMDGSEAEAETRTEFKFGSRLGLGHQSSESISAPTSLSSSAVTPTATAVSTASARVISKYSTSSQTSLRQLNFAADLEPDAGMTLTSLSTQSQHDTNVSNLKTYRDQEASFSISRKSSAESWDEGFIAAYPHVRRHPHVWAYSSSSSSSSSSSQTHTHLSKNLAQQTPSVERSGGGMSFGNAECIGSGNNLDTPTDHGASVALDVHVEAATPTVGNFRVAGMQSSIGLARVNSKSVESQSTSVVSPCPILVPSTCVSPATAATIPPIQATCMSSSTIPASQAACVSSPISPVVCIARVSSPVARIASPTPSFSLPTSIRLAQQDLMESLDGYVNESFGQREKSESVSSNTSVSGHDHATTAVADVEGSALPYLAECDEGSGQTHEHEREQEVTRTAMMSEDEHDGKHIVCVPRPQKPPVGLGVRSKMIQASTNIAHTHSSDPRAISIAEHPYTSPPMLPTPISPTSDPAITWVSGLSKTGQTTDANAAEHPQSHRYTNTSAKTHRYHDGSYTAKERSVIHTAEGAELTMKQSLESTWKSPPSPLFDNNDPFNLESPKIAETSMSTEAETRMRGPRSAPASVTITGSKGTGSKFVPAPIPSRMLQLQFSKSLTAPSTLTAMTTSHSAGELVNPPERQTSLPRVAFTGLGSGSYQTPRVKGVTMRTLSMRSQSPGGLKTLLLANPGNRISSDATAAGISAGGPGAVTPNGHLNASTRAIPRSSAAGSLPTKPSVRTVSNGSVSIAIPSPAPTPVSKALPPLPRLKGNAVGDDETLRSVSGSIPSMRSTSMSSVKSTSTASLRSTHSSSSLCVQREGQAQSGLPMPVSTPGRPRAISNASGISSSILGPTTNASAMHTPPARPRPRPRPSLPNSPIDRSSAASTSSATSTTASRTASISSLTHVNPNTASRPPSASSSTSHITTTTTTPYVRTRSSSGASEKPLKSAIKPPKVGRSGAGVGVGSADSMGSIMSMSVSGSPLGSGVLTAGTSSLRGQAGSLASTSGAASIITRNRRGIQPPKSRCVPDAGIAI